MSIKKELIDHVTEATKEFNIAYLRGNSRDIYGEILEDLEYNLYDNCDQTDAESQLDSCDCPDLDSWAPYYYQRTEIVKALDSSSTNECEDWLEGIYGKGELFNGCESFTDVEARMACAALELGFAEAKEDIKREIETFYESREDTDEASEEEDTEPTI